MFIFSMNPIPDPGIQVVRSTLLAYFARDPVSPYSNYNYLSPRWAFSYSLFYFIF